MPDPPPPLAELLADATERTELAEVPGKSGATLERVATAGGITCSSTSTWPRTGPCGPRGACAARRWCSGNAASWPACRSASTSRSWARPGSGAAARC